MIFGHIQSSRVEHNCILEISKDGIQQTVYLKKLKNGNVLFKDAKNAKELECSKNFTFIPQKSNWEFNKNNYEKEIFKKGKALIRGYWGSYTPKLKTSSLKFNTSTYEANKHSIDIAEINDDGTFEIEIDLDYPLVMYIIDLCAAMYIQPNDTLLISCNLVKPKAEKFG